MILSTHTEILPKKFGYEETVKLYAKTGFDAVNDAYYDYISKIKEKSDK